MPIRAFARRHARHLVAPALVALAALAAACAEVGTDPSAAVSIEFSRLPSPSILVGDTLRDLEGKAVRPRDSVWVFNQANDTIHDYPVRFIATVDTARLKWDSASGYLVSTATTGLRTVGIQAQAGGLFPPPVNLIIVPNEPNKIDTVASDTTRLSIVYVASTGAQQQSNKEFTVRVRAADSLVTGWPVEFTVAMLPASLESARFIAQRTDTVASRQSPWDTTQTGNASRYILATRKAGVATGTKDTLVVQARFRARGGVLRDSVQLKVPVTFQ